MNRPIIIYSIFCIFSMFLFANTALALLIDNADGTITQTRNDGSMLMWLQDANYAQTSGFDTDGRMTWFEANAWIQSLNEINYITNIIFLSCIILGKWI